jgi:hypothetical protein
MGGDYTIRTKAILLADRSQTFEQIDITALLQRCAVENEHFRHGEASDQRYAAICSRASTRSTC